MTPLYEFVLANPLVLVWAALLCLAVAIADFALYWRRRNREQWEQEP